MTEPTTHLDVLALLRGELTNAEVASVADHLEGCESCRDELVQVSVGHALLARASRTLGDTRAEPGPETAVLPPLPPLPRVGGERRWLRPVGLVAAAAALIAGTVAVTSYLDRPDDPPATVAQETADLEPVDGTGSGRVDMVNHDGRVTLTFTVRDLPEAQKGQFYYGWLLEPATNKMLPLGQLGPGGSASFEVPESLVREYHSIDVEPRGRRRRPGSLGDLGAARCLHPRGRHRGVLRPSCSGVLAQVAAEVRHGEGDPAALAGVDQPLLEQRVAGRATATAACARARAATVGGRHRSMSSTGSSPRSRSRRRRRPSRAGTRARPAWPARTRLPKKPTASSASASGAATATSSAVIGDARREVPDRLAVGLDEVGVAAGGLVQRVERLGGERGVLVLGGRGQREVGGRRGRAGRCASSGRAAPSRTWSRDSTAGRCGSPAPTTMSGSPRLADLVAGRAQRRDVVGPEVLHLVDEHRDALARCRRPARRGR